jgi:hypothetical protein
LSGWLRRDVGGHPHDIKFFSFVVEDFLKNFIVMTDDLYQLVKV